MAPALDALRGMLRGEPIEGFPAFEPLERIGDIFGLSEFERLVLMLAAAPDVDGSFTALLPGGEVTFGLALEKLPGAHWDAIATDSGLRRWELIKFAKGTSLTHTPIQADESVLLALLGVTSLDEQLLALVEPLEVPCSLADSRRATSLAVCEGWRRGQPTNLIGMDAEAKREVHAFAADEIGLRAWSLPVSSLPADPAACFQIARNWTRHAALNGAALFIEGDEDVAGAVRFAKWLKTPSTLSTADRAAGFTGTTLDVPPPPRGESADLWRSALGPRADGLNGSLEALLEQFAVPTADISTLVDKAAASGKPFEEALWQAARESSRRRLDDLAQRLHSPVTWEDLVLPDKTLRTLRDVVGNVRHRAQVLGDWGFGERITRGLGVAVLFHGASGTGKTLAAEVLANELRLDLFRIDLASIVSKYIGETEKNLRRIFDAAERCGAVLLFDEADALFGKRTEVKDSHDRYANIEVGYLLQRMESYRGIAILTTNMKESFDSAFLRRLRFVVEFPFPGEVERAKIWRRCLPDKAPLESVDFGRLAKLGVPGGNIRNIALSAAFLASGERQPIGMKHLLSAAKSEYSKIERPLTDAEVAGWL